MAFREVRVFEVKEVLRLWLGGESLRAIERVAALDRKTVRRDVEATTAAGQVSDGGEAQLDEALILDPTKTYQPTGRPKGPTRP